MAPSRPNAGSKQFWPRKRAKRIYSTVKAWFDTNDPSLLGFAGYKAGMTQAYAKDTRSNSMTKGEMISVPATVIECPPLRLLSIRFFTKSAYGSACAGEVMASNIEKSLKRKIVLPKSYDSAKKLEEWAGKLDGIDNVTIKVYTQPKKAGIGKKTPEVFEIGIGGNDAKEQFEFVKGMLDREVKLSEVIKSGTLVDVHGVTKGKGFQGNVKRFGITLRSHKSEKKRRASVAGPRCPGRVMPGVKMPGQMGFHTRTEHNKDVLLIGDDPTKVNPRGGFLNYGNVKSDYLILKGSVPGPQKRLIRFAMPIRAGKAMGNAVQVESLSLESQQ
jgi:large subunit ribosomal protein L3